MTPCAHHNPPKSLVIPCPCGCGHPLQEKTLFSNKGPHQDRAGLHMVHNGRTIWRDDGSHQNPITETVTLQEALDAERQKNAELEKAVDVLRETVTDLEVETADRIRNYEQLLSDRNAEIAAEPTGKSVWTQSTGEGPYVVIEENLMDVRDRTTRRDHRVSSYLVRDRKGRYLTVPKSDVTMAAPARRVRVGSTIVRHTLDVIVVAMSLALIYQLV